MLTKNLRTHFAVLSDGKEIPITTEQFNSLTLSVQDSKGNDFIKIKDVDTNETLFHGKCILIKEFREKKIRSPIWIRYFCDFWISHELNAKCECSDKFDVNWWEFKYQARKLFWKQYMQDLIESERVMTLKYCKKRFHTSQENK